MTVQAANRSAGPLVPKATSCYQRRQAELPALGGYAFLNTVVRGDGWVVSTSVFGEVDDLELMRCLEQVLATWRLPAIGGDALSDVTIPFTFRVEEDLGRGRKKR
jgi:hypothetical protein